MLSPEFKGLLFPNPEASGLCSPRSPKPLQRPRNSPPHSPKHLQRPRLHSPCSPKPFKGPGSFTPRSSKPIQRPGFALLAPQSPSRVREASLLVPQSPSNGRGSLPSLPKASFKGSGGAFSKKAPPAVFPKNSPFPCQGKGARGLGLFSYSFHHAIERRFRIHVVVKQ